MKFLASIFITLICCLSVTAQTAHKGLVKATAIVDGLFFDNSVSAKELIPANSTTATIKDPDGKMVLAVYVPEDYELDASVKEKAIPLDRVRHAEKLLRDYEGRRPLPIAAGIGVSDGKPFIKFEYTDIEGIVWNNEKLKGRVFVINIWQSECGPCRREMPVLSEWKERFPDVVFISASRHNSEEILPIAEKHHFTWTHLQEATGIVSLVGQQGFPLTIVVDKDGMVRFAETGASEENQARAIAVIEELNPE